MEGGLAALCDEVWLVTCDPAVQRERLASRGTDAAAIEQRLAAQAGMTERLRPAATLVLDTSGGAAATREAVARAFDAALEGDRATGTSEDDAAEH